MQKDNLILLWCTRMPAEQQEQKNQYSDSQRSEHSQRQDPGTLKQIGSPGRRLLQAICQTRHTARASNATRQHSANAVRNFSSGTLPSLAARMAANAGANNCSPTSANIFTDLIVMCTLGLTI